MKASRPAWARGLKHIFGHVHAVEESGKGIGRIRLKQIPNASGSTLNRFLQESVTTGSVVHTDGWKGYRKVSLHGYEHKVTVLKGKKEVASELLPRVHLVISLLKRWLMGTHQGAVSHKHLDYNWMSSRFGLIAASR